MVEGTGPIGVVRGSEAIEVLVALETLVVGGILAFWPGAFDGLGVTGPMPLSWNTLRLLIAQYASLKASGLLPTKASQV